jgi:hypothetical protein
MLRYQCNFILWALVYAKMRIISLTERYCEMHWTDKGSREGRKDIIYHQNFDHTKIASAVYNTNLSCARSHVSVNVIISIFLYVITEHKVLKKKNWNPVCRLKCAWWKLYDPPPCYFISPSPQSFHHHLLLCMNQKFIKTAALLALQVVPTENPWLYQHIKHKYKDSGVTCTEIAWYDVCYMGPESNKTYFHTVVFLYKSFRCFILIPYAYLSKRNIKKVLLLSTNTDAVC